MERRSWGHPGGHPGGRPGARTNHAGAPALVSCALYLTRQPDTHIHNRPGDAEAPGHNAATTTATPADVAVWARPTARNSRRRRHKRDRARCHWGATVITGACGQGIWSRLPTRCSAEGAPDPVQAAEPRGGGHVNTEGTEPAAAGAGVSLGAGDGNALSPWCVGPARRPRPRKGEGASGVRSACSAAAGARQDRGRRRPRPGAPPRPTCRKAREAFLGSRERGARERGRARQCRQRPRR